MPPSDRSTATPDSEQLAFAALDPNSEVEPPAADSRVSEAASLGAGLELVLDVPVWLSVELGRTEIEIREVVNLGRGSMIELDRAPGAPLDVRVNGVLIGRGEIVLINDERLGLRFLEVVSPTERLKRVD